MLTKTWKNSLVNMPLLTVLTGFLLLRGATVKVTSQNPLQRKQLSFKTKNSMTCTNLQSLSTHSWVGLNTGAFVVRGLKWIFSLPV